MQNNHHFNCSTIFIFNKENEYQFFGDEIGYTQGFGISYDVEFNSFSELISKIRKKNK